MSEKSILPWIAVKEMMDGDYRNVVVRIALQHLPKASKDLQAFARQEFNQIPIRGFRYFDRADIRTALPYVATEMKQRPTIAAAVICLWSEAMPGPIKMLREQAESTGLHFRAEWNWQRGAEGFYTFELIPELSRICDELSKDKPKPEADHLKLAALWLGRTVVDKEAETPATSPTEPETDSQGASQASAVEVDTPVQSPSALVLAETPETLATKLSLLTGQLKDANELTAAHAHQLIEALERYDMGCVHIENDALSSQIKAWLELQERLGATLQDMMQRINVELHARPDLVITIIQRELLAQPTNNIATPPAAEQIQGILRTVIEYDQQVETTRTAYEQTNKDNQELRDRLLEQGVETNVASGDLTATESDTPVTLADWTMLLKQATLVKTQLITEQERLKVSLLDKIKLHQQKLSELGTSADDMNLPMEQFSLEELAEHQMHFAAKVDAAIAQAQALALPTLVQELRAGWGNSPLTLLLEQLAYKQRDVEAILLLLSANLAQPRTDPLVFAKPVVDSLLRGVDQLSEQNSFELLNQIALNFLSGWKTTDPNAQASLCIAFIGAQYAASHPLPIGLLWELTPEWPVRGMPSWERLWKGAAIEEPLPLIYSSTSSQPESLQKARLRAEQMMERKSGLFVCLHALKHRKHMSLLGSEFLPELSQRSAELRQIQDELASASEHEVTRLRSRLGNLSKGKSADLLNEERLDEHYQARVADEAIVDESPFHIRSALNLLHDCAKSVAEYQQALSEFAKVKEGQAKGLSIQALQSELEKLVDSRERGRRLITQLQSTIDRKETRDDAQAWFDGTKQIIQQLLSQASFAIRLPRVVSQLTHTALDWHILAAILTDDLADAPAPERAAEILLDAGAPSQALMLAQDTSLETQKRAQTIKTELEHRTADLQTELLKFGGQADDLATDRMLGRWTYLTAELEQRLDLQRARRAQQTQQNQERQRLILSEINKLEETVVQASSTIPPDVYTMLGQGFDLARQMARSARELDSIDGYLKEIRYRFEHRSWTLTELQDAIEHLERAARGEARPSSTEFASAQVQMLLEREELAPLGLEGEVSDSEVGTRCDVLRNWQHLREMPAFLTADLDLGNRNAIRALFHDFAKMVKMKNTLNQDDPVIFAHYELQFPQTQALRYNCVLIALPGKPPRPENLKELEQLIDEKRWLEDSFVLLLVPGCTENNAKRLRSHHSARLVILDERAMLDMILAEARGRIPLGRLRSMMLQACGVENVEVFRYNQLVRAKTAIFVGREGMISKIVNSDGSYALYGGRRIGKSSILAAIGEQLEDRGAQVVFYDFQGLPDCSDDTTARKLATRLNAALPVNGMDNFKSAIQNYLDSHPDLKIVILLDEIEGYINQNRERHILIEALRSLSDQYSGRFRVIVAGFMNLYACLRGAGPYPPTSGPWRRMFNADKPVENVRAASAEKIVRDGFLHILGWDFENRGIPQLIVERTGCHPAFVQRFCDLLQRRVSQRGDRMIRVEDVEAVFADPDPADSFIAYVRDTLEMNLDPISRYLILWLAVDSTARSFTLGQAKDIAATCKTRIPEEQLLASLEQLRVNNVVEQRSPGVFEFSVPEYPLILRRLGNTEHIDRWELEIAKHLGEHGHTN